LLEKQENKDERKEGEKERRKSIRNPNFQEGRVFRLRSFLIKLLRARAGWARATKRMEMNDYRRE